MRGRSPLATRIILLVWRRSSRRRQALARSVPVRFDPRALLCRRPPRGRRGIGVRSCSGTACNVLISVPSVTPNRTVAAVVDVDDNALDGRGVANGTGGRWGPRPASIQAMQMLLASTQQSKMGT